MSNKAIPLRIWLSRFSQGSNGRSLDGGKIIFITDEVFPVSGCHNFVLMPCPDCAALDVLSLLIARDTQHHLQVSAQDNAADRAIIPRHQYEMNVPFAPFVLLRAVPGA
jgi:hypothetical protein